MHTMTLFAADRDVINDIRTQGLQRLHEHRCRGLSVYVKVTPDADQLVITDRRIDTFHSGLDVWERCWWQCIWVQERACRLNRVNAAPDESLRNERRQIELGKRGREFYGRRVDPAGHLHL